MAEKKHRGTKDKAKCSFYKSKRKHGLTTEQIQPLWEAHQKQVAALKDAEDAKLAEQKALKAQRVEEAKANAERGAKRRAEAAKLAAEEAKKAEAAPDVGTVQPTLSVTPAPATV